MAARVSQVEGQRADPDNFLLMHAMGAERRRGHRHGGGCGYFIARLGG